MSPVPPVAEENLAIPLLTVTCPTVLFAPAVAVKFPSGPITTLHGTSPAPRSHVPAHLPTTLVSEPTCRAAGPFCVNRPTLPAADFTSILVGNSDFRTARYRPSAILRRKRPRFPPALRSRIQCPPRRSR